MNTWSERRRADEAIDELLSGRGTATALLQIAPLVDDLRDRYAHRSAPTPNAELEQVLAWGFREEEQTRRAPAVAWLPKRRTARAGWGGPRRVLVAVLAATFALGGIAIAGAEPAIQNAIADAAKAFGLDLPRSTPDAPSRPPVRSGPADASAGQSGGIAPAPAGAAVPAPSAPGSASSPSSSPTTSLPPGAVPPGAGTGVDVPPITVPPVDLPPITSPPIDLPPVTLPPVDLPPITSPPITLPPLPPLPPIF